MTRLGVIAALPAEASCYSGSSVTTLQQIIKLNKTLLIVSGMGSENAAFSARKLIHSGADALVSWGTAGGLSEERKAGDILLPEFIQLESAQQYQTDSEWRQQLIQQLDPDIKVHGGLLLHTENVITSKQHKSQLGYSTGAVAVDMESGVIAALANQNNIPVLIIRSIVDTYDETIPVSATKSIDEFGRTNIPTLITHLLKMPADIPKLIRLGSHFNQARKSLTRLSRLLGTTLAFPDHSDI